MFRALLISLCLVVLPTNSYAIGVCKGGNYKVREATCIHDGDTGWQGGIKWRTLGIDTPEIGKGAACSRERKLRYAARDRLIALMNGGYEVIWGGRTDKYGRYLVDVILPNGQNASDILKQEGLAQNWPNSGNVWCN